jgi:CheY-like chemotaxis protein
MPESKNILIVEDEKAIAHALEQKFLERGYRVCVATNGEEGLICAQRENPDLILVDMMMPVMDGPTMLERLREQEWGKEIPAIALSNLNEPENISRCMECGVYDYLVKSDWRLEDIVAKVFDRIRT